MVIKESMSIRAINRVCGWWNRGSSLMSIIIVKAILIIIIIVKAILIIREECKKIIRDHTEPF